MTTNKKKEKETILVVDDDEIVRKIIVHTLNQAGYLTKEAENGESGLKEIQKKMPDLLVTDIQMPVMNGIDLLAKIHELMIPIPVIIITGQSRVEDVIKTLRLGVRDFIRKPFDSSELLLIIQKVLKNPHAPGSEDELIPFVQKENKVLILPNDSNVINMASYYLTRNLPSRGFCSHLEKENIRHALYEALTNAMIHGNLELASHLKNIGQIGETEFHNILSERIVKPPYKDRKIRVTYQYTGYKLMYRIEDEGKGFDYDNIPDPLHPDNIYKPYGRGVFFIRLHTDKLFWNQKGNVMTMIRYKDRTVPKAKKSNTNK